MMHPAAMTYRTTLSPGNLEQEKAAKNSKSAACIAGAMYGTSSVPKLQPENS